MIDNSFFGMRPNSILSFLNKFFFHQFLLFRLHENLGMIWGTLYLLNTQQNIVIPFDIELELLHGSDDVADAYSEQLITTFLEGIPSFHFLQKLAGQRFSIHPLNTENEVG